MAEAALVLIMISLSLFTRKGDIRLQCYQVDPVTRVETKIGQIVIHRKTNLLKARLINWGPEQINSKPLVTIPMPDPRTPLGLAIYDEGNGIRGHAIVLSRSNTMKKRFILSDDVNDWSQLNYCEKISKGELEEMKNESSISETPALQTQ